MSIDNLTIRLSAEQLECFQEKWPPVFRPETRQNNNLGSGFDSIKTGKTLADHVPTSLSGSLNA